MSDETTRLRAMLERAALPACEAECMGHGKLWCVTTRDAVVANHRAFVADIVWAAPEPMGSGVVTEARARLFAAIPTALPGLLDAAERAEREHREAGESTRAAWRESERREQELRDRLIAAERERDDLAAVLETRTAEHALAMARVTELEAIIAGRTTPPTDEGEGDGGETPAEIVARLRRHANEARRCAAWEHSQGMHLAAENSCRDARDFDAQADRMATAEVSRG